VINRVKGLRLLLIVTACTTLACSLQAIDDGSEQTGDEVADAGGGGNTSAPTVQIVAPVSGQQVTVGSDVEIQVQAEGASGVDRLQLSVSGRTSSTKAFPEPANPAEALLRWRPDRTGTFELTVTAFRGSSFSEPAVITLEVLRLGDSVSNPAGGQPDQPAAPAGDCVGRILIGNLRMRNGPGTTFNNVGYYDLNEQVTVVGQNDNSQWVKVRRLDASENWASNNPEWIELTGNCTGLPVAS
jgi:hypothetical protein